MRAILVLFALTVAAEFQTVFPYGAVYPEIQSASPDWERDHAMAAKIGMNLMRHRPLVVAIEVAPGQVQLVRL